MKQLVHHPETQTLLDKLLNSKPFQAFKKAYGTQQYLDFAGDNFGPIHPDYQALVLASGNMRDKTYQLSHIDNHAKEAFEKTFGEGGGTSTYVALCPTGTSANRLATFMLKPGQTMITSDIAHAYCRESNAISLMNSTSIKAVPNNAGKLDYEKTEKLIDYLKKQKTYSGEPVPRLISLSQPTEYGTVYTPEEVKAFADLAHKNDMLLQMDGSRLFYAAATLNKSLRELTTDCDVDTLFLGGSKNLMNRAEATVFLPSYFKQERKGLLSKLWKVPQDVPDYITEAEIDNLNSEVRKASKQMGISVGQSANMAAQWLLALEDNHAVNLAQEGNKKAKALEKILLEADNENQVYLPTQTNVVLISAPKAFTDFLQRHYKLRLFLEDDPARQGFNVFRMMTHGMTSTDELDRLKHTLKQWDAETNQVKGEAEDSSYLLKELKGAYQKVEGLLKADNPKLNSYLQVLRPLKSLIRREQYLEGNSETANVKQLMKNPMLKGFRQHFTQDVNEAINRMEVQQAEYVMAALNRLETDRDKIKLLKTLTQGEHSTGDIILDYSRESRTTKEAEIAGIDNHSSVLVLGAGPLPITAIGYAMSGGQVYLLDREKRALNQARQFLDVLPKSVQSHVHIIQTPKDAKSLDYAELQKTYKLTHIATAAQIDDKDTVLSKIKEDLQSSLSEPKPAMKLLVRSGKAGLPELVYKALQPETKELFTSFHAPLYAKSPSAYTLFFQVNQ